MGVIRIITVFFLGLFFAYFAMQWMDVSFPPDSFSSIRLYDAAFILAPFAVFPLAWTSAHTCVQFVFRRLT